MSQEEPIGSPLSKFVTSGLHSAHYLIKHLEQSKSAMEDLVYKMPGLFMVIDKSGQILKSNRTTEDLLKVNRGESLYKNITDLIDQDQWQAIESQINSSPKQQSQHKAGFGETKEPYIISIDSFQAAEAELYYLVGNKLP